MLEPVELKGPPAKSSIFKDWSLYTTDKITPQLPKNIKYTPPQSNEELRKRIGEQESKLNEVERISVGVCLSYLERGLMEEVRMHLAYRWFTRLDFSQEIPDHSTFSENRHARFRQSGEFGRSSRRSCGVAWRSAW